ncbi:uncharacterized protein LOC133898575, partial [Phragmites australis]|uniref:uncharacterized protein LOC133898575 n=1 Tax=Phragmites australis TaxID=29695 RepID=UPI002D78C831
MDKLECVRPNNGRRWGNNGAVALDGKLWWIDLACGLLTSNTFACDKVVRFVHLPPGCALLDTPSRDVLLDLDKTRSVKVSQGKIRYVEIHRPDGFATVTMWSLDSAGGDHQRECDYRVPIGDIWADPGYAAATEQLLVEEMPVIA